MKSAETETTTPVEAGIHDRGRGPEIKGTRITVYSILDCLLENWPPERIADWFQIRTDQVEAAVMYIREHTREVLTEYLKILERSEHGNPPELEAELEAGRAKLREIVERIQEVKARAQAEIQDLIREHREWRKRKNSHARNHGGQ
jgi:uncharacterized protein (DUF433 family)